MLKPITLGHDFGNEVEVVAGLNGDETVIVNPPDSVVEGETVRIAQGHSEDRERRASDFGRQTSDFGLRTSDIGLRTSGNSAEV